MSVAAAIAILIVASFAGVALGWLGGARPIRDWRERFEQRDREARELDEKFRRAITELAGASERAARSDALTAELAEARERHGSDLVDLRTEHAAILERLRGEHALTLDRLRDEHGHAVMTTRAELTTALDSARADHARTVDGLRVEQRRAAEELATLRQKTENFDEQKRLLLDAQVALKKEFEAAGAKVLEGAQDAFLRRAAARFEESEKASAERLGTLLAPVDERLKSYERQVSELEAKRVDAFGQLNGQIEALRMGQDLVRAEAARLGNSLRNAPKARGRWGEQQLRNVLEQCGLAEHTDFDMEHSIDTEDGRLRPDAIVRIPGNKLLVIDAKVSLNAYQDAFDAQDDEARGRFLDAHAASMRAHIQTLGAKSYQSQFEEAPDYVLMFVPGEHFIAAALEHDPQIWNFAFERRVLLASPTNLVAIARTVAQVWRQDGLAREAREIGRMGGELYGRLKTAADHLKRMGAGLESAVNNYNKFVGSFERNVLSAGRRLQEKHIEISKGEIEEVPMIESSPRYGAAEDGLRLVEGEKALGDEAA